MTVHFAAARNAAFSPIARALTRPALGRAANDNASSGARADETAASDHLINAALRHFANHGLGAAREARKEAEIAFFKGDRQGYDWWLAVCRTLDKRIAGQLDRATNALENNSEIA